MKKNGFIATSVMYSFFVVFALLSLTILATYSHYRSLNTSLNSSILDELNLRIVNKYARLTNLVKDGNFDDEDDWTVDNARVVDIFYNYDLDADGVCDIACVQDDGSIKNPVNKKVGSRTFNEDVDNDQKPDRYLDLNNDDICDRFCAFNAQGDCIGNSCTALNYNYAFSGSKSMNMYRGSSNNTSFRRKIDVSGLEKDNEIHQIYFRFRVYKRNSVIAQTGNNGNNACIDFGSTRKCYSDFVSNFLVDGLPVTLDYNPYNWALQSGIWNITFNDSTLADDWDLEFFVNGITTNYAGQLYVDDIMIIDISDIYGSNNPGNSEVKEYLDTYLEYFDGEYAMSKCNRISQDGKWVCE